MTELEPCPFCGGAPTHFDDPDHSTGWVIYCMANKDCLIHDRELWGKTKADVFAAWNTRAAPRTDGDDGELVDWLKAIAMRQEHDHPFKVIGQSAARITALSAEVERKDAALRKIAKGRRVDYSAIDFTYEPLDEDEAREIAQAALGAKP